VFSTDFIRREISTADNIKDRSNRQTVQRLLRRIEKQLSTLSVTGCKNGLLVFAGVGRDNVEVFEVLVPEVPSRLSLYRCDNKFHAIDAVKQFFLPSKQEKQQPESIHVLHLTGEVAELYVYRSPLVPMAKLRVWNGNLVKRHRKGGFSQNRFARIAEESRHGYIDRVVSDWLPASCTLVYGSKEMCELFKAAVSESKHGHIVFINKNDMATVDQDVEEARRTEALHLAQRYIDEVTFLLANNPDRLVFGVDEVNQRATDVRFVLAVHGCALSSVAVRVAEQHMPVAVDAVGVLHYAW
jgi:hypothetical protein